MNDNRLYCVYMHVCKINNKIYVGITNKKPKYRWGNNGAYYLRQYKDGRYFHPIFACALKKYKDWNNDWKHIIFAENLQEDEAKHFEKLLIALYKTNVCRYGSEFGYNCTDGGEGTSGFKMSDETKRKIGNANKGKVVTEEQRKVQREAHKGSKHTEESKLKISQALIKYADLSGKDLRWVQYNFDGTLLNVYYSVAEASRKTNINRRSISNCVSGRAKSAGGFMWLCVEKNDIPAVIEPYYGQTSNQDINVQKRQYKGVVVCQYDKNQIFVKKWNSMTDAAETLNIGVNNIWKCCNHIEGRKTAGGFIWVYDGEQI